MSEAPINRRVFLASAAAASATLVNDAGAQITHVDTSKTGPALKSSTVKLEGLPAEGDSPGAKAYVQFNGPTKQLAAVAAGVCTLEPGARPHPPHTHPEEELMWIGSGTGEIVVAGITTQVQAGDCMYAESNVLHGIVNTGSTSMTFYFTKFLARGA